MTDELPKSAGDPTPVLTTAEPAVVSASPVVPLACPYQQVKSLQQALSPDKMRVGFFLGAGCPSAINVPTGGVTEPLIPNIEGLTDIIRIKFEACAKYKDHFKKILRQLGDSPTNKKTVEHILTQVRGILEFVGTATFEDMNKGNLRELDKAICREIANVMRKRLSTKDTPYHQLAEWIVSIPRAHPVEIFTSNYDLLMEQALEECGVPYFDGFSGSDRTFFDVTSMEQQLSLPPRWARLWKVHGSINWWRTKDGDIQRREKGGTDDSQMIHPSHLKYDESRKMPYLAMQDRLRSFLARGQAVLVTCGYSFLDGHLNQAILDGLSGNPSAVCFGLVFDDRATASAAIKKVGYRGNLRLLGVDGGVQGTVDRDWHSKENRDDPLHGIAVVSGTLGQRTTAPDDRCKFLLGDFKSFGVFLADQLASRDSNEEDRIAT